MLSLDIRRPGMNNLQFVLFVVALGASGLSSFFPLHSRRLARRDGRSLRDAGPHRSSAHGAGKAGDRSSFGMEVTREAMVETIRGRRTAAGMTVLTRDHPPSEPALPSMPSAPPLIERLQHLYPPFDPGDHDGKS